MDRRWWQALAVRLLVVSTLVLLAGSAGYLIHQTRDARKTGLPTLSKSQPRESCNTKQAIKLCVSQPDTEISPSQTIELTVTLTNVTDEIATKQFSSGCTEPTLILNNAEPTSQACTMVVVDVPFKPGASKTYRLSLEGASLEAGENTGLVQWADITSEPLQFVRTAQ